MASPELPFSFATDSFRRRSAQSPRLFIDASLELWLPLLDDQTP
jgi:hypothetical protein